MVETKDEGYNEHGGKRDWGEGGVMLLIAVEEFGTPFRYFFFFFDIVLSHFPLTHTMGKLFVLSCCFSHLLSCQFFAIDGTAVYLQQRRIGASLFLRVSMST